LSGNIPPMSCVLANKNIMDVFNPSSHGSTFGGNPLACAISIEALKIIDMECLGKIRITQQTTQILLNKMFNNNHNKILNVRGLGMFWGLQFNENYDIEKLRLKLLDLGYITCTARNNTLRITPPLTISNHTIEEVIHMLDKTI